MSKTVFDAILGHDEIVNRLCHALQIGRPGHAWLFHGPDGVGKRTMALALIQSLFCQQPLHSDKGVAGCGLCIACRKCLNGNHPDLQIFELLEKKVRISIDQIRELTRFVAFSPLESTWKAIIIDDAALMNQAAANALLKTLEEPPPGSLLILLTSQPGSLLPTLWSRCQKERFLPLSETHILTILARKIPEISSTERQEATRLALGSVGTALQLCAKGAMTMRRQFFQDLERLPTTALAELLDMASEWSKKEHFCMVPMLLETWFRDRIRDNVFDDEENRLDIQRMLEAAARTTQLIKTAHIVNLNPRLTLETIFIRLARMQGAAF